MYIYVNPCFEKENEIKHELAAWGELAAGGELVAVRGGMSGEVVGGAATWCSAVTWQVKIK